MMKKAILILLSLATLLSLFACAKTGEPDTTTAAVQTNDTEAEVTEASTVDGQGFLLDSVPDGLNYDTTIHVLYWDDYTMTEFFVDEIDGNNIDSAIYTRNARVESRLGVDLQYTGCPGSSSVESTYIAKAEADWKSDHLFDVFATYSRTPPTLALSGYLFNLNTSEYFDKSKPWWPEALTKECDINGKLYFATGDISTNLLWMMTGTFYNRKLYADRTGDADFSETPEELVKQKKWTLDRLFRMTKEIYEDTDNSGKKSDGDTYGMIIYQVNIDAFQSAAGYTAIIKNPDGHLSVSPDFQGEKAQNLCSMVGDFVKSQGVYTVDKTTIRNIFFEQRAIFCMDRCFIVAGKDQGKEGKIEFSFGIVPQPKYSADQEDFCTNVGHPFTMYAVSSNSHNPEAAATTLEVLGSESYRLVTPEVFENTMKIRYSDGAEAAEMYDTLRRTVSFDLGRLFVTTFGNTAANALRTNALGTPASYTTNIKRSLTAINKGITKIEDYYFGN
ncbi:MAG: hypothetical protein J6V01_06605 [Clostridia bacterium]|nr:hypothetical protein [Clostridia bacterium]